MSESTAHKLCREPLVQGSPVLGGGCERISFRTSAQIYIQSCCLGIIDTDAVIQYVYYYFPTQQSIENYERKKYFNFNGLETYDIIGRRRVMTLGRAS